MAKARDFSFVGFKTTYEACKYSNNWHLSSLFGRRLRKDHPWKIAYLKV
jgi:hypothetical protein